MWTVRVHTIAPTCTDDGDAHASVANIHKFDSFFKRQFHENRRYRGVDFYFHLKT